ncbi:hypothetical protein ACFVT2_14575 [Streptomyces sp. NPDC058000]|uniref:hypothetical protein n=1 Tax=Streptomyces sp. NPDC058000 TaxID=3346299 RepID=UPI0036E53FF4
MTTPQPSPQDFDGTPGYGAPGGSPYPGPPAGPPPQIPGGPPAPGAVPYGQPGPYGAPQAPYGGAPQALYGYPGPGMPPPVPPRRNTGKVWGIIGAVAGVLVIGGIASALAFGGGGGGGGGTGGTGATSGPKYRITVPQTLAGGTYTLTKDISQQAGASVPRDGANEHGITSVGGQYTSGTMSLVMVGLYGTIDDPRTTVDHSIRGMKDDAGTQVAVPEKEFTPSGGGAPVTCGVDVREEMGQKITLAFCVWADSRTSVNLARTDAADLAKDPRSVDLQAFADAAGRIRGEVTKPLG